MFDFVRKHTKLMMSVMFLLIIPSFVLFGIDGYNRMGQTDVAVARIGDVEITQAQLDQAHRAEADRLRGSMPNIDPKLLDSPLARQATLERLVREQVLAQAAIQSNWLTSDARLAKFLQSDPTIASLRKPDGTLDMQRYGQLATSQGWATPEGFENSVRQDLSKQQIELGVRQSALAAHELADLALKAAYEQREVQVQVFAPSAYSGKIVPTPAELSAFFQANASVFRTPEQARVEYVVLDMDAVKKTIQIAEPELKAYYEQNVVRLSGVEERKASHILLTAAKTAPAAEREQARARAQELLKAARAAPAGFAELARKNSQDPGSATQGGDLGFFQRGAMVKPFEDAVFVMKKGDISEVVESDYGFHVIMLTDVKLPVQRSLDELRPSLLADLKTQQAQRKYAEVAEIFTNTVYEQADSLKPVAERLQLEVRTVPDLQRVPAPGAKGPLANEKLLAAVFSPDSLEKKRNTEAVEVAANQLVAARVLSYSPARAQTLEEVSGPVRERVIAAQARAMATKDAQDKLAQWKAKPESATLAPAVVVSRDQPAGLAQAVVSAALRADRQALPAWVGVDLAEQGYAVLRVNQIVTPNEARLATMRQGREQYSALWSAAETKAYYETLKARMQVQLLAAPAGAANAPEKAASN